MNHIHCSSSSLTWTIGSLMCLDQYRLHSCDWIVAIAWTICWCINLQEHVVVSLIKIHRNLIIGYINFTNSLKWAFCNCWVSWSASCPMPLGHSTAIKLKSAWRLAGRVVSPCHKKICRELRPWITFCWSCACCWTAVLNSLFLCLRSAPEMRLKHFCSKNPRGRRTKY